MTVLYDAAQHRRSGSQVIMQGQLIEYPLPDLLQFLNSLGKHVHLLLERTEPRVAGGIYFGAGRLIHAYCPPIEGEDAVIAMLGWQEGRFLLVDEVVPERTTITTDLQALLLEGLRQLDESSSSLHAIIKAEEIPWPRERYDAEAEQKTMTLRAWRVLAMVDGKRTVAQIAHILNRSENDVRRDLSSLANADLIKIKR